jgi:hypothetical protein
MTLRALSFVLVLALALPAAALEGPHCFCRIQKSDCGDCNPACVAEDDGAIAQFRVLQTGKDDLCKTACREKLNALTEANACSELQANLHVPLPWGGELHSCWAVGAGSFRADLRRTVACAAPPPPVGQAYPPSGGAYWKTTQWDDFKGKPADASPEVAACYDRAPSCAAFYVEGPTACATTANLKDLDKCTWTVLHKANWMGPDTSVFDSREVRVDPARDNGVLVLSAHAVTPAGAYLPTGPTTTDEGQTLAKDPLVRRKNWDAGYSCEATAWGQPLRNTCPIVAGAVVSQQFGPDAPPGFAQQYGRFAVRAKVAYGAGSFPGLWMLPVSGSWPGAGELDIMESPPNGDHVWQTLHTGNCQPGGGADLNPDACTSGGGSRWHLSKDGGRIYPKDVPNHAEFWADYHVFAVEWDERALRFSVDGVVNNEIKNLDYIRGTKSGVAHHWWNKKDWEALLPAHLPDSPFHWILNVAVHDENGKYPNPKNFVPQEMLVDWVKTEAVCRTKADFCPSGGDLDVASNRCVGPAGVGRPVSYDSPCKR